MVKDSLNNKVVKATKWSAITEIAAKLVTPITSMVLARLLTPEAFGIVATLTMIISFAEIFTDAGFQKYLIQHEFVDDRDREESTNVAFWSNFVMSLIIWGVIYIFNEPLASLVGNPGLGHVIVIACVSIPLASFSSIQMALYKRDLDFKTLFKVRIVAILIPLVVTIPLAFFLKNFWALVLGTITQHTANAILLTAFSKWKPSFFYSLEKLKEMFSFTVWSMIEAISIWLTGYVDVFIVGTTLSQYYLGLYKTGSTMVGHVMGVITTITTPILFSSLSRLQNNESGFHDMFFRFQKLVGLFVIPLGFGFFIFRDFVTEVLLGSQWGEAAYFVGIWALTSSITIVMSHFSSEVYRAKGKPKLSVLSQWLIIAALWPVVIVYSRYGFETLCTARALVRLESVVVNLAIMGLVIKMPVCRMITNVIPFFVASAFMFLVLLLPPAANIWITAVYALFAGGIYLVVLMLFPSERNLIINLKKYIHR